MSVGGTETQSFDHAASTDGSTSYVIAIDNLSSRRIDVPEDGVLQIGRSPDADIRIDNEAVSRVHAKLIFANGRAQIADLGSHNGTLVNGERIEGTSPLVSGDVITIAETLLILRSERHLRPDAPLDADQMFRRIDQEIARATDYDRPFSVVVVAGARPSVASQSVIRPMDVVGINGSSMIVLMPELDSEAGAVQGRALVTAVGTGVRAGIATFPADGGDAATLLAAARAAIPNATAGEVARASTSAIEHQVGPNRVIVADPAMVRIFDLLRRLAKSDLSVLVTGETGSGKENAAAAVHYWSRRASGPFVALNCAALPETLAESELFGYERGAFSEAKQAKAGLLERSNGGTLFLDEVGDLSLALQAKLLRAIEVKKITRLGDVRDRDIDVRIVAATNIDLEAAVLRGVFRQDLLYRLSAARVTVPALRHRRQEIPLLARRFAQLEGDRLGRTRVTISESALAALTRYEFPGNVRELKNAIDFAIATAESDSIRVSDLPDKISGLGLEAKGIDVTRTNFRPLADELRELESRRMIEALEACDGVQTRAAAALGMPLRTFTFRMRQYGIDSRKR